jgi:hypothetical protein
MRDWWIECLIGGKQALSDNLKSCSIIRIIKGQIVAKIYEAMIS